MPQLELYENKVLNDTELPIQLSVNRMDEQGCVFTSHWHEHLELHYIVSGGADMQLGQRHFFVNPGDLLIANCNELHSGLCTQAPYEAYVVIFDLADISPELAKNNFIFTPLIRGDATVRDYFRRIFAEAEAREPGYKQMCRGLVTELLVHLCRRHVDQTLPEKDSIKRKKALDRLNAVLCFIEEHYAEHITVGQLAAITCLSEDRFGHLFREGVGVPPLQYINDLRLRKAMNLLRSNACTVTAVADAVGFRDYNHFGRLFRKRYGCTPSEAAKQNI